MLGHKEDAQKIPTHLQADKLTGTIDQDQSTHRLHHGGSPHGHNCAALRQLSTLMNTKKKWNKQINLNNLKASVLWWLLLKLYLFSDRKLFLHNCLSEPFLVNNSTGVCFDNKYIPVDETASIKNKLEEGSGFYGKVTAEEEMWPLCVG